MQPQGNFKKEIMIVLEVPDEEANKANKPAQGRTGKLLIKTFRKLGIDLFEDCIVTNAVNCYSEKLPTNYEIDCCRKFLLKAIDKYKPKVVVLLGASALYSLIGYRWKKDLGSIVKWRGWQIPDQDFKTWICPTFSVDFVEDDKDGVAQVIWEQDLKEAVKCIDKTFSLYKEPDIKIIKDLNILNSIQTGEVAVDFETSGIKPHASGHRIVCCSVADTEDSVYVFLIPQTRRETLPLINLLSNEKVGKIAANLKFEHAWAQEKLRVEIKSWSWDTMLAAHVLDNRQGITGLQFQVYATFGVLDFKDETEPYLKAKEDGGNAFNRIEELISTQEGVDMLLRRNALDSIFEYRLANVQRNAIKP
jgi:uracil-DNA glycosylase family 4